MHKKIVVVQTGYMGLSLAVLLAQHNEVVAWDIVPVIGNLQFRTTILDEKELNSKATTDAKEAYEGDDFVIITTPTNYDSTKNFFDTLAVEAVVKLVKEINPQAIMMIKSTIQVGFTASVREKYQSEDSPEFLGESKALYDNLYPCRIIVGADKSDERVFECNL